MFKRMQVGDVVVLRSDEDAQLLRAIEGNEVANWVAANWQIPDMTLSVKKISDSKYDYSWCEKLQCPKWWSTCTLPRVSPIPEGYEPAFEGEEIQKGWKFFSHNKWLDCVSIGDKVQSFFSPIIKPKKPASSSPAIPGGYELVKLGDKFEEGDMRWSGSEWIPRTMFSIGTKCMGYTNPTIRKKPAANTAEHGPIPDGYEVLGKGEMVFIGDRVWDAKNGEWKIVLFPGHLEGSPVVIRRKTSISTMEHQDGATTTTVSVGGVGSKFEKNGREYEVTHETEVAHSNGLREIEIKAVSKPVYGQGPVKTAVDEMDKMWPSFKDLMLQDPLLFLKTKPSKQAADALDAVAEASKILGDRPSFFDRLTAPEIACIKEMRKRLQRKDEIKEIVQSVVEKLS